MMLSLRVFGVLRMLLRWALVLVTMAAGSHDAQAQSGSRNITLAKDRARQKWALLVGVNKYNELKSLAYCHEDVQELSRRLVKAGFPAANVFLLTSDAKELKYLPFKTNIQRQLELLSTMAGEEDLVLVAFSGHGTHLDGASYLCPAEARVEDPKGTMVALDLVYQRLAQCKARWKLLLVDACRNDPRPAGMKDTGGSYEKSAGDFAKSLEKPPQGILALTSCAPGEVSMEADEFHHGVFMNYFLEGLSGKADQREGNGNGQVSLLELYRYTNVQTKRYVARKYNRGQTPTLRGEIPEDYEITSVTADPAVLAAVAEGNSHVAGNRYDQAITAFSRAIQLDPRCIPAYDGRGQARYRRGDYAASVLDHTLAIQLGPQAVSLARRSLAYLGAKELDKAMADAQEAIRLDRSSAEAHCSMGAVLTDRGRNAEALAEFDEAVRLDPKCAAAFNNRGCLQIRLGELRQAMTDLNEAIRLDSKCAAAYYNRGLLYERRKEPAKALADWSEVIRLDPNHFLAHIRRGVLYGVKDQYDLAQADFTEAIRINPKSVLGYNNRGWIYRLQKNLEASITALNEAIRRDPDYALAHMNRGKAYVLKEDYQRAIADFGEAIRLEPKNAAACVCRANAYMSQGQYDKALDDATEAIRRNPKSADAYFARARALCGKRRYQDALTDYNECLRLNPRDVTLYNNRGNLLRSLEKYDQAIADYDEAIRLDPKNWMPYSNRALVKHSQKDLAGAVKDFNAAITLGPDSGKPYWGRGVVYLDYQQYDWAIADLNEAIRREPNWEPAYRSRARAYRAKGMTVQADADQRKAEQLRRNTNP